MIPETLNWTAVIVGTIAAFAIGFLWYGKLFTKPWMEGSRLTQEDGQEMPIAAMVLQILGLFLLALVIGVTATTEALGTAILAILAAAVLIMSGAGFSKKTKAAMMIEGGYVLVAGVVMIIAQGAL